MGESRGAYRVSVGKPEGRTALVTPRRRWDNIKMDLRTVGWGVADWITLPYDKNWWQALVNAVMDLQVP
jgi:hypothetical protein